VIVYLLRELTKKHENIWATVTDSDGQFLLVEAAGALPAWLEPDIADNRVSAAPDFVFCCRLTGCVGMDKPRRSSHNQAEERKESSDGADILIRVKKDHKRGF
jgi:hypothetical protein